MCPQKTKTGGTELLHQLYYQLSQFRSDVYLVYSGSTEIRANQAFIQYIVNAPISVEMIEDKEENLLIVPEIYYKQLAAFKNMKKAIWWLSVDFFLQENSFIDRMRIKGIGSALKNLFLGNLKDKTELIKKADLHYCQSYYAIDFLKKKGIKEESIIYLSDYVNDLYLESFSNVEFTNRENFVVYNPKKGKKFTKKLMLKAPQINWVSIQNMTNEQVHDLLCKSKVYIDFGNHPGKDRIPREAALSGCCVITGRRGAANYFQDVCIPDKYKFIDSRKSMPKIIEQINDCLNNYNFLVMDFADYRKSILQEKEKFESDVKTIFL